MLAFRIFVMLSCLIIVPMAAIFGSAFPDVVKSVLVDRIVYWATGKWPEATPSAAPSGFGTVAPAKQAEESREGMGQSEAPRWGAKPGGTSWQVQPSSPLAGGVMPAAATLVDPAAGNQQADYVAAAPTQSPAPLDPFTAMERKLREYGATYYLLETWGNDGELFRFHCKMAIGNNPNCTRHFEATDHDALQAMSQVLTRVEAWRAGRPQ